MNEEGTTPVVTSNILVHGNGWPVVFSVVPWGIFISTWPTKSCSALNSHGHLFVMTDMSSSQLYIKNNGESYLILLCISQGFFYTIHECSQVHSLQSKKFLLFLS